MDVGKMLMARSMSGSGDPTKVAVKPSKTNQLKRLKGDGEGNEEVKRRRRDAWIDMGMRIQLPSVWNMKELVSREVSSFAQHPILLITRSCEIVAFQFVLEVEDVR